MADEIFDNDTLASYLGVAALKRGGAERAALANGLVYDTWANPVLPVPPGIRAIGLEVAARAIGNPKGLESLTRAVDDGSQTERYGAAARAGVYLTAEERRTLLGVKARRQRSYGTIRLRRGL